MADYVKSLIVFVFYGLLIGLIAWAGYHFTSMIVNVSKNIGAIIGAVIGIMVSIGLWFAFGKKFVEGS